MIRAAFATALGIVALLAVGGLILAGASEQLGPVTVAVRLDEGLLRADRREVTAGPVVLDARNAGAQEHELALLRTDLPADRLPVGLEGVRYERAGRLVLGEAHDHDHADRRRHPGHIAPGGRHRAVADLEPGRYVLLCNLPGHYAAGQRAALTVAP